MNIVVIYDNINFKACLMSLGFIYFVMQQWNQMYCHLIQSAKWLHFKNDTFDHIEVLFSVTASLTAVEMLYI